MRSLFRPRHCCTSMGTPFRYLLVLFICGFRTTTTNAWQLSSSTRQHVFSTRRLRLYSFANNDSSKNDPGSDPVLRLPLMEAQLATMGKTSFDADDPKAYVALEGDIADARTAAEFGVRAAQLLFYDAFSAGDLDAMDRIWSTTSHVRVVHPGMMSIEGRDAVMSSWKQILASPSGAGAKSSSSSSSSSKSSTNSVNNFRITPYRTQVEICGLVAICSCVEKLNRGGGDLEALNVYKRENGTWKMTFTWRVQF